MTRHFLAVIALVWASAASAQDAPLLNSASAESLSSLDHVDTGTAERIVALRTERGRFGSVEELRVLPGVGEQTLASLRHNTRVDVQMPNGTTRSFESVDQVLAEFDHEPSVQQVHRWTEAYAKVNPDLVDRWLAASRGFAVLPRLQVEGRVRDGFDQDFKYFTADGVIDDPNEAVFDVLDDAGRDQQRTVIVRATWDLDELIMSSERIRVINESQDVAKLRDKLLDEVTRVYFERRRVQVDMLLQPSRDVATQTKDYLRLMELTANIDALTGGELSRSLVGGR
ncbi:MAG: competence protein ComEA [Myxococcota bacterium]|jgi:competence protein ComEA